MGWAIAVAATTLVIGLESPPFAAAVITLLLVLVAPTSVDLGRRLVTNLTLMSLGLVLLRWIPWEGDRTWIGLSLATGTVAWLALTRGHRSLLPRTTATDLLPLLAGVAALAVTWPLLGRTPTSAMALLMGGWDHAGHFSMYLAQREGLQRAVPLGETYSYVNYPQLFHAWLAGLGELVWGAPGGAADELVRYSTLQAIAFVGVAVVSVAATVDACAGRRPRVRMVAGALVASLVLGFPGPGLLSQGYLSVLWSIVGAILVINLSRPGITSGVVQLAVAACGVVAVAAWPLLLPVVGYAWLSLLLQAWRAGGRPKWLAVALGVGTGSSTLWLMWVSGRADPGGHVVTPGGIQHTSALVSFAVPALILISACMVVRHGGNGSSWAPVVWSATGCLLLVCGLAAVQWSLAGELSYYFWKTALCGQTILLAVVAPDVAHGLDRFARRTMSSSGMARALVIISTAGLCCYGLGVESGRASFVEPFQTRLSLEAWSRQHALAAEVMEKAADSSVPWARTMWVKETDAYAPALPDQWLHSFTRSRTPAIEAHQEALNNARVRGPRGVADAAIGILRASTVGVVVSDPMVYALVSDQLNQEQSARLQLLQ